jgi:hypothetical protein
MLLVKQMFLNLIFFLFIKIILKKVEYKEISDKNYSSELKEIIYSFLSKVFFIYLLLLLLFNFSIRRRIREKKRYFHLIMEFLISVE